MQITLVITGIVIASIMYLKWDVITKHTIQEVDPDNDNF